MNYKANNFFFDIFISNKFCVATHVNENQTFCFGATESTSWLYGPRNINYELKGRLY